MDRGWKGLKESVLWMKNNMTKFQNSNKRIVFNVKLNWYKKWYSVRENVEERNVFKMLGKPRVALGSRGRICARKGRKVLTRCKRVGPIEERQ